MREPCTLGKEGLLFYTFWLCDEGWQAVLVAQRNEGPVCFLSVKADGPSSNVERRQVRR